MTQGWFVTGTDTGVGKTVVAAGMLRALGGLGYSTAGMKPVASGCHTVDGELRNPDAEQLMGESNVTVAYNDLNPFAYAPPIAPHLAAAEAGRPIDVAHIAESYRRLAERARCVVVEGVGGWLVPLDSRHTVADLAATLRLPVILVVGLRLGCLNHALLSVGAIHRAGTQLAGWVANRYTPDIDRDRGMVDTLRGRISAPFLGDLPFVSDDPVGAAATRLQMQLIINTTR